MFKKQHIANLVFILILVYIISPWFFEKKLLFNEIISLTGISILIYKGFKIESSQITKLFIYILILGLAHLATSIFRTDSIYFYLRNTVIVYSMFGFFIGYFLFEYGIGFIKKIKYLISTYIIVLLLKPVSPFLFERFSMSNLFPIVSSLFKKNIALPLLIILNIIYSINYDSATTILLSGIYLLIWICPSYLIFRHLFIVGFLIAVVLFTVAIPYITINPKHYSHYNSIAIYEVINSHPIFALDPNSTWRLVIWKQLIIDLFPSNIIGIGMGTPALKYHPVEDYSKLASLPYVLGGHNSFIYLFARLGILYVIFTTLIYNIIFKEYFKYKLYYIKHKYHLIFYSFIAITFIALFNPTLESPIYASSYWFLMGFLAKAIYLRQKQETLASIN